MINKLTKYSLLRPYLTDYSKRIHLREFARIFKKPYQSLKPILEKLVKERVLQREVRGRNHEYSLRETPFLIDYLTIAEKEFLRNRLQNGRLLMLYEKLSPFFEKGTYILFGSAVINVDKANDVDLICIGEAPEKVIKDAGTLLNREIELIDVEKWRNLTRALRREVIKKHIILNNTEQVIRWMHGNDQLVQETSARHQIAKA